MTIQRAILLGDSHIGTLLAAQKKKPGVQGDIAYQLLPVGPNRTVETFLFDLPDGRVLLNPLLTRALSRAKLYDELMYRVRDLTTPLVILFGSHEANRIGFDAAMVNTTVTPDPSAATRQLLTAKLLSELIDHRLAYYWRGMAILEGLFRGRLHVLFSPPPQRTPRDRKTGRPLSIAPLDVRGELWRIGQELIARRLGALGIDVINFAPEFSDETGFLRPEYEAADGVHANEAYGLAMQARLAMLDLNGRAAAARRA